MCLNEVREVIREAEHVQIHFCCKRNTGEGYYKLTPEIHNDIADEIKRICQKNLEKIIDMRCLEYSPVGANDDTVEICSLNAYGNIPCFLTSLDEISVGNVVPEETDFFVYEFNRNNTDKVYVFRRHNKLKSLRKGLKGLLIEGTFQKLDDNNFFGIDESIDILVFRETVWVVNHVAFERIFDLKNEFIERATQVLNNQRLNIRIKNFEQLRKDILGNMNYVKRVSKLDENNAVTFLEDSARERVSDVIQNLNLDISMDAEGRFAYEDKRQISIFVNFMQDAYYETIIGRELGVDERRG